MGPGGWTLMALMGALLVHLLLTERPFAPRPALKPTGLPQAPLFLEKAPGDLVANLTPPWQKELADRLTAEGFLDLGEYSHASTEFFWAKVLLSPDRRAALLLVNWKEGGKYGAPLTTNLEIYSFGTKAGREDFLLTACAQDGSARLLTGANRPRPDQLSLHLKMVFNALGVSPLLAEHQGRLFAWEKGGGEVRFLEGERTLTDLAKAFSGKLGA